MDQEIVRTRGKSFRDLKVGITGYTSLRKGSRTTKLTVGEQPDNRTNTAENGISDASKRLMKMVDDLENAQFDGLKNNSQLDEYEQSVEASKATLSSAKDFLKELSD